MNYKMIRFKLFLHKINIFRYIKNWLFCKKYPFWKLTNNWYYYNTGCDDRRVNSKNFFVNYNSTWYDDIPKGWRIAFGKELSKEIKRVGKAYLKEHKDKKWEDILCWEQIKEKWGELCLYASAIEEIMKILEKYEIMSIGYCISCGKPSRYITKGWITFQCEDCFTNYHTQYKYSSESIEQLKEECRITSEDIPTITKCDYETIGFISAYSEEAFRRQEAKIEKQKDVLVRNFGLDIKDNLYKGEIIKCINKKVDLKQEYGIDFKKLWGLDKE